jgi:NAD(P)H-hydrate epimerase
VVVCEIGIPSEAELFVGPGDARRAVQARNAYSHKGDFGYVLVVGGSNVFSGAPALAGLAALRTGAGLAVVATPKNVSFAVRSYSPNLIVHSLEHEVITSQDVPRIVELLKFCDSLVLGPGMGLDPLTVPAVPEILKSASGLKKPVLIDADAIKALSGDLGLLGEAAVVLTPHAGEFESVSGIKVFPRWQERLEPSLQFARKNHCVLVLKGHDTIITDGNRLKVNRVGNPGMATGGVGDVLSGIIGAFLAQREERFLSATAGAYVNGMAGDLVFKEKGFHMVASDLVDKIPFVLREFDRSA